MLVFILVSSDNHFYKPFPSDVINQSDCKCCGLDLAGNSAPLTPCLSHSGWDGEENGKNVNPMD